MCVATSPHFFYFYDPDIFIKHSELTTRSNKGSELLYHKDVGNVKSLMPLDKNIAVCR